MHPPLKAIIAQWLFACKCWVSSPRWSPSVPWRPTLYHDDHLFFCTMMTILASVSWWPPSASWWPSFPVYHDDYPLLCTMMTTVCNQDDYRKCTRFQQLFTAKSTSTLICHRIGQNFIEGRRGSANEYAVNYNAHHCSEWNVRILLEIAVQITLNCSYCMRRRS